MNALLVSTLCTTAVAQPCLPTWQGASLNGAVRTILSDRAAPGGPQLLVGGAFTNPAHIARYNDPGFSPVGAGLAGEVRGIVRHDDGSGSTIYVTGFVNVPRGQFTGTYARLLGGTFATFGPINNGPNSWTGVAISYNLGQGSKFLTSGGFGVPCDYVTQWNGSSWECLAQGLGSVVHAAAEYNDGTGTALFCVGSFVINGFPFSESIGVAKWDGIAWHALGGIRDGFGETCVVHDDGSGPELFVAGRFTRIGANPTITANRIAKWNGQRWASLGSGIQPPSTVSALAPFDDGSGTKLYVGGDFTQAGGVAVQRLARWDGSAWSPCPAGGVPSGVVSTLSTHDPDGPGPLIPWLAVGGQFSSVAGGEVVASNFAVLRPAFAWADFNGDGFVDGFDYDAFVACFEGDPCPPGRSSDFNRDGFPDGFDYDAFVTAFEAGCP